MDQSEELAVIRERLARARRRVESATYGGPEWDAAMDEVDDLEARLRALADDAGAAVPTSRRRSLLAVVA